MKHPQLSILIPAAGASKRLGQAKQLVRYKNGTLIQHAVDIALSIEPRELVVVTGANGEAVKDAVQREQVRWIHNPDWCDGMGSSIAIGAAAISSESTGVMILLSDQWRLRKKDLSLLVNTWLLDPERIVCAQAELQNMPPVIFPVGLFSRLKALGSDHGARQILKDHPKLLRPVTLINASFDMDTPGQLDQLKHKSCNN